MPKPALSMRVAPRHPPDLRGAPHWRALISLRSRRVGAGSLSVWFYMVCTAQAARQCAQQAEARAQQGAGAGAGAGLGHASRQQALAEHLEIAKIARVAQPADRPRQGQVETDMGYG